MVKQMKKLWLLLLLLIPITTHAISASSYVVLDQANNQVLKSSNMNDQRLIASISKIMTCIVAIENSDINQIVTVDKNVLKAYGSAVYLEVGEKISLKDLLYGMMMRSGNDAATMIAIAVSGSMDKFAEQMNNYAQKIGMKNTHFINSHGLENEKGEGNQSSAYDMAILTSYAMKNAVFREIFQEKNYTAKSDKKTYTWLNKNKLLKYDYITGGKTGFTKKARRTLVTTGKINGIDLVIVTLNDGNDWQDHIDLYQEIKNKYNKIQVLNKNKFKIVDDVIYVEDQLYINNDHFITVSKDQESQVKIKYYLYNNKKNYHDGEQVGMANVYVGDSIVVSEPIYIKIKKKNAFHKFIAWLKHIF